MTQEEKNFLEALDVWKKDKWIIYAAENHKRFWCNLSNQYKVMLRLDTNSTSSSKTIYIGDDLKKAYEAYINLPNF